MSGERIGMRRCGRVTTSPLRAGIMSRRKGEAE